MLHGLSAACQAQGLGAACTAGSGVPPGSSISGERGSPRAATAVASVRGRPLLVRCLGAELRLKWAQAGGGRVQAGCRMQAGYRMKDAGRVRDAGCPCLSGKGLRCLCRGEGAGAPVLTVLEWKGLLQPSEAPEFALF